MNPLNIFKKFKYIYEIRGVETHEIDQAPDGWLNTVVEYDRSKTYNGVLRNLTIPFREIGKAAYLCRREYAKYSLMSRIVRKILLGDGLNNYSEIYRGKIDFSTKIDSQNGFAVSSKSSDFSGNIDAYADQKYSLSLEDGVYVELTPIILNETASILMSRPPDGNIHADYFVPIQVVNNKINSINQSVYNVNYEQLRDPDYSTSGTQFFKATVDIKLYIKGSTTLIPFNTSLSGGNKHLSLSIVNSAGVVQYQFFDDSVPQDFTPSSVTVDTNIVLNVPKGESLFIYSRIFDAELDGVGIVVTASQLDLSYQTITPATMCKALTLDQIFGKLLQQMNVNTDSGPNQPMPYQSFLLKGLLKNIVVTSSDSIRASQGSIYHSGDTLFQGIYKVLSGTATYGGTDYTTGQQFTYTPAYSTFTGDGIVEKITAIYAGVTYQVGDTLQAGGTYLVEGDAIVYNAITYEAGETFKYVLGQETFTGGDSSFVKQIAADPQLITSFSNLFQTVKSLMGGNATFGVDKYTYTGTNPDKIRQSIQGTPFIESLDYVFRSGVKSLDLGVVDAQWKSSPAVDLMYNTIKVGYQDQQYDAINGTQEVNSTQYYASPLLSPVAELNLISDYRGDPIGIETVRVTQQDTAASRSDNDAFMIWIKDTPENTVPFTYYHPKGAEGFLSVTGVDPSYYNYGITPKQNLLRGGPYLASIFYNMPGYELKLTGFLKNISLITVDLSGKRVSERDPIEISNLPKPLFIPEYYETTQGVASELVSVLDSNPYGDMTFTVNNKQAFAFISNLKVSLANEKPEELKLLLSADNNLADFVRF